MVTTSSTRKVQPVISRSLQPIHLYPVLDSSHLRLRLHHHRRLDQPILVPFVPEAEGEEASAERVVIRSTAVISEFTGYTYSGVPGSRAPDAWLLRAAVHRSGRPGESRAGGRGEGGSEDVSKLAG